MSLPASRIGVHCIGCGRLHCNAMQCAAGVSAIVYDPEPELGQTRSAVVMKWTPLPLSSAASQEAVRPLQGQPTDPPALGAGAPVGSGRRRVAQNFLAPLYARAPLRPPGRSRTTRPQRTLQKLPALSPVSCIRPAPDVREMVTTAGRTRARTRLGRTHNFDLCHRSRDPRHTAGRHSPLGTQHPATQPPTYPTSTPQAASGGRCRAGKEGSRESGLCSRADAPVRYWQPAPPPLRGVRVVRTALPAAGGPTLSALAAAGVAQVPVQEHTTTEWMSSGWHVCLRAACAAAESQPASHQQRQHAALLQWPAARAGAAADMPT
jgi:hypothetical protein